MIRIMSAPLLWPNLIPSRCILVLLTCVSFTQLGHAQEEEPIATEVDVQSYESEPNDTHSTEPAHSTDSESAHSTAQSSTGEFPLVPLSAAFPPPPAPQNATLPVQAQVQIAPSASTQPSTVSPPAVVADRPPSTSTQTSEEKLNGGVYFDLNFGPAFGVQSTHEWKGSCPQIDAVGWSPNCKISAPLGGLLAANLGFQFGFLGIEAFGFFASDYSSAKLEGAAPSVPLPSYATQMQIGRIGGALGGGVRAMTNDWLRVSIGLGGGVIFRDVFTNVSSLDGSAEGYVAPLVKSDMTLSFGKFFNLGVMGWVEFSPTVQVTPQLDTAAQLAGIDPSLDGTLSAIEDGIGAVTVFRGPQFIIAPFIGFHFGG
jgi:hypothetical protein